MTLEDAQQAEAIARLWDARELDTLLNDASRKLTAGTGTDWGTSVTPRVPSISMGGGIPDPASLPRAGLLRAVERALAAGVKGAYGLAWETKTVVHDRDQAARDHGHRRRPPGHAARRTRRPPPRPSERTTRGRHRA